MIYKTTSVEPGAWSKSSSKRASVGTLSHTRLVFSSFLLLMTDNELSWDTSDWESAWDNDDAKDNAKDDEATSATTVCVTNYSNRVSCWS